MKDQRRSQRIRHDLVVELHEKRGARKLHAVDVARHGLFLATDDPPRERHLVQLTVHLPHGAIRAAASVTRTLRGQADHADGVGIQFFALSDDAKERWDDFIFELQRTTPPHGVRFEPDELKKSGEPTVPIRALTSPPPASSGATFLVKLKTTDRLKDFQQTHLAAGGTVLFTPVLRAEGDVVTLVVVHPRTDEEFRLPGLVHKAHADRPKRLEIHFHGITPALLNSFAAYVESGHPPLVQLEAPPPLPNAPPPSPESELDLDVDVFDEETLDTDDRIWRAPGDVSAPPTPNPALDVTMPPSAWVPAPIEPGLRPSTFLVRCDNDACTASPYGIDLGPSSGVLGLIADHAAFVSSKTGDVVTALRAAAPEERAARVKAFTDGGGRLDASVDLQLLVDAAALAEPPREPGAGPLKETRAIERLGHAALRLVEPNKPAKTKVPCAHCKAGHLTIEKVST